MSTVTQDSPSPKKNPDWNNQVKVGRGRRSAAVTLDITSVLEVRATWTRIANSPWAGYEMRYAATLVDGGQVVIDGSEFVAVVDALQAAGVLVQSVEGWSRVARRAGAVAAPVGPMPRPATIDEALGQMVARGKEHQPKLDSRLDLAAELVRDGRVVLDSDSAQVGPYRISATSCTCADHQHRGGWCKHRLAVRMARHLVAHGFELPDPKPQPATQQISPAARALINSGAVIDAANAANAAYRRSREAARQYALTAMSQGQTTLPADVARRAGIAKRSEPNHER